MDVSASRMARLRDLICGSGAWGNDDTINLIYWNPDINVPGTDKKGCWVAWQDPDPLPQANVCVAP